jgi:putative RNA 2'-phosphotransferase
MDNRAVRISKFLSRVLRHQPEKIGLSLDQSGWASVERWLTEGAPVLYLEF